MHDNRSAGIFTIFKQRYLIKATLRSKQSECKIKSTKNNVYYNALELTHRCRFKSYFSFDLSRIILSFSKLDYRLEWAPLMRIMMQTCSRFIRDRGLDEIAISAGVSSGIDAGASGPSHFIRRNCGAFYLPRVCVCMRVFTIAD